MGAMSGMKQAEKKIIVATTGPGLYDVTDPIAAFVASAAITMGLCTVFIRHTSASLVIQENADPAVLRDMEKWIARVAPEDARAYEHDAEGPDDMPAHLRSAITRSSESIPVTGGVLSLGTWQAIYVWEHRRLSHRRELVVHVLGA
jgi:secondary thiamine-phosphate synthase enzyme